MVRSVSEIKVQTVSALVCTYAFLEQFSIVFKTIKRFQLKEKFLEIEMFLEVYTFASALLKAYYKLFQKNGSFSG